MIPVDYVTRAASVVTFRLTRATFKYMLGLPLTQFCVDAHRNGQPDAKRALWGISWQATFEPNRRKEENARPNGLFALDVDHIGWEQVGALWCRTAPRIEELDIVAFHRSPSGDGARIVALCQPQFETIAENQAWLAGELETPFDPAPHDLARLWFIVPEKEWMYVDFETLFE